MPITHGKSCHGRFWRRAGFLLASVLACSLLAGPLSVVFPQVADAATVSDNFDRANGALGSNWTTTPGLAAPQISGNTLHAGTASSVNSAYWSANTFGNDQFSQGTLPGSSGASYGPGLAVRLSGTKGYFLWYGNSGNTVSLWRMDSASSWTQVKTSGTLAVTPATDVWKIQVTGSTISGYQNGNLVVQATDTKITSGSPGVWMYYAANQIDNWSGGDVTAAPTTYSVGGTVSGLASGGTVVLQNNGGNDLSVTASGSFTFSTALAAGSAYNVTVKTSPTGQTCSVAGGTGTVGSANVTNVAVTCTATPAYTVGGTLSGLTSGGTVVLQNNGGNDLSVTASGSFTFSTALAAGSAYNVTVKTSPTGQSCTVAGGTGTVGSANVTNVAVACSTSSGTATDNFNRANGALGSNWTGTSDGALTIASQVVKGGNGAYSGDVRTSETYTSDQSSQVEVTSTQLSGGQWIGPAVRAASGGKNLYLGIYFWNSGSPQLMLFKRTNGSWTQLGSSYPVSALPASTQLTLTAVGSTITFLQNGTARITATDTSLTGGAPGIMAYGTGTADNWAGASLGTPGTYSVGGTVSGLSGTVVLQNNGGDDLSVSSAGSFTFPAALGNGAAYSVTVKTSPSGQTCSVANGSGTVSSANVTSVAVTCATTSTATSGSDDFNRADGALGANWASTSDGGLAISSQAAAGTSASGVSGDIRTAENYASNQYSQVTLTSTQLTGTQWAGPAVRLSSNGQSGYLAIYYWNSGSPNLQLYKRSNGSWTQLGSTYNSGALAAGTQLKLEVVGTTLALLVNGTERIAAYDDSFTGGAPGILAQGTGKVDSWSGGSTGFEVHYLSTDSGGVESYDVVSASDGDGPQVLRVLRPANPAAGVKHNFLFVLPVEPGTGTSYGDGIATMEAANAQNQYNLTIIEPSFAIDPWYADNPDDANLQYETFMTNELVPWVKASLASSGSEQDWLIGFSKSGIGGQDLLLKHPGLFSLGASWDFPADESSYDQFGASSAGNYGTDASFQAGYRLSASFLSAHKAPFVSANRIWIGGYNAFPQDMTDYDALLTQQGIQHTTETPTSMAHRWDGGWVPLALAALEQDSTKLGS